MKKLLFVTCCWFLVAGSFAQNVSQKLQKAFQQFERDSQLKHAVSSLYVLDAKTGQVVFDKNSQVGLAPASTQKIITSVTAFELLGREYRYKTYFFYGAQNAMYVMGNGDPTFGSWRYLQTIDSVIFKSVIEAFLKKGKTKLQKFTTIDNDSKKTVPSGWIYEDIGNYYGAAARNLNWRENQFDITFIPGDTEGEPAEIDSTSTFPPFGVRQLINNCKTGKPGSGDNAYVYFVPGDWHYVIEGTVPAKTKRFTISASNATPFLTFGTSFLNYRLIPEIFSEEINDINTIPLQNALFSSRKDTVYTHYSPSLDSIIYWFLKKSINLYGEALIKTFAYEKQGFGSTDSGVAIVKKFWKDKGLDEDELNIYDGSGLSPLNRVTTHSQVEILKYAKTKEWFPYFLNSLPEYNDMTMKSGTISDVKGFCGYHKSKNGKEYIFSFLVNNYTGKTSGVVNKMYKVLDELK
jgi:D-alanyl-D-alanine carboxypeptidase/D-alanyl-D-alanine-endopeptidase (penicillin-binding protein 4)